MKKILVLSVAVLFLPLFASAATLNNTFNVSTLFPVAGGTVNISSTCGASAANSTVSFTLMQNVSNTALPTTLSTDANGAFSGSVVFPENVSVGQATLMATCNSTGDTIDSPVLTFTAPPASISFILPQASPTVSGIYNLSGACGSSNGNSSTQLTLNQNGNNYTLDNISLSSSGTFSDNVVIPNTVSAGPATLTAVCSNGARFSSSVDIGPTAVNSFSFSSSPFPGSSTTISGNCTNVSGNQNGAVSFAVLRSGTINNLSATSNQTNGGGYFSSSAFFPSDLGSNPATLVVTCPNGSTFSNVIMLGAADPVVLSAADPVGGVAAGSDPQQAQNYFVAGVLLITGLFGLFMVTRKNSHAQK